MQFGQYLQQRYSWFDDDEIPRSRYSNLEKVGDEESGGSAWDWMEGDLGIVVTDVSDCGIYVLLCAYHLAHSHEVNSDGVTSSFRVLPGTVNLTGYRLLWLEYLAQHMGLNNLFQ
jgi:hypothetical protein